MGRHSSAWDEIDEAADFSLPLPFSFFDIPLIGKAASLAIILAACIFSVCVPAAAKAPAALHFTPVVGPPSMNPVPGSLWPKPAARNVDRLFSFKQA